MSIHIDFTDFNLFENKIYRKYIDDFRRYQIFKGGAGAGKSVFVCDRIIYNIVLHKIYNGLVIRNTGRDNHDSTFAELQKSINKLGLADLFTTNHSRGAEEIICKLNKNKIVFRGLDDVEKIKSVTFETGDLIWVWIEEASEVSEDDFNQLDIRLRGVSDVPKHIIMSFNPIDIDCWIKPRFFDSPLSSNDGFILETTYKDNTFIDDTYKRILESYKEKDYYFYKVYVLNEWGARTTARVFHNVVIEEFDTDEKHFSNIRSGIDFGYNHANAYELCGFRDGELYIYKETYAKNQLNKDFIKAVDETGHIKSRRITADSADPDKIAEWNNEGYCVSPAIKGPGSLLAGINYLKALPKIHIHKNNCPNAAREFVRMKYKELKDGTICEDVVEIDDDTVAAVRYATEEFHATSGGNFNGIIKGFYG